jgi:hypothetical protein
MTNLQVTSSTITVVAVTVLYKKIRSAAVTAVTYPDK